SSFNAFPNPATSTITISYYLNQPQSVSIFLYDLTGKMAGQLLNETEAAGTHTPTFALDRFSAGVYMIKLTAGNQSFSRKVIKL
ncbi:MAG TPA: T9SS type A sorting domain-containing protein, partial [Chitinophagales bacterium]|nr:T9SS type A sorting domain-containing protein [Chitinophagales bacterium]